MEQVKNYCLAYTKQNYNNVNGNGNNRQFYLISSPSEEEIYMCDTKSVIGYKEVARADFGKRSLADIDKYTLENFHNELDFFECLGLSQSAFGTGQNDKSLFIAHVLDKGWVEKMSPIFNNDELLAVLQSSMVDIESDFVYDPDFINKFYSMVASSDKSFYNYLKSKLDEKDRLLTYAADIRFVEKNDVPSKTAFYTNDSYNRSEILRSSLTRELCSYTLYRKAFLYAQSFSSYVDEETKNNPYNMEEIDPYSDITGMRRIKK